jgi:tetratricopeptide (TPR) repeat protein
VWPEALLLVALLAASLWALYRGMALGVAAAFFFIALAPTSSFVPIVTAVGAERRMYLPLMGVVVVVVFAVRYVLGRWAGLYGVVVGCLAAMSLGGLTIARNAEYRDPVVLWASAIKILPDNLRAWAQLGDALVDAGRFTEAVTAYDSALRIFPSQLLIHISRARGIGSRRARCGGGGGISAYLGAKSEMG